MSQMTRNYDSKISHTDHLVQTLQVNQKTIETERVELKGLIFANETLLLKIADLEEIVSLKDGKFLKYLGDSTITENVEWDLSDDS